MKKNYITWIILFLIVASFTLYLQIPEPANEGTGMIGRVISSPAQSATTITGLVIVFVLVILTLRKEE